MKAPGFWYAPGNSVLGAVLSPLGLIYGWATALRQRGKTPFDPGVPVVCVGNLTAGGAGKTPVVLDIARRLSAKGLKPHVISRGYGGAQGDAPRHVNKEQDSAADVGDEPLMMAATVPVWVGSDRPQAARAAVQDGAGVLILDDGFQDPSLVKTVSLVVADGRFGFGNGFMIPAGPLRETLAAGLARADGLIVLGPDAWGVADAARRFGPAGLSLVAGRVRPGAEIDDFAGSLGLAFAGIGQPDKFFQTLRDHGCRLAATQAFPDHHAYSAMEIDGLRRRAKDLKARLLTTEKDWVRIPEDRRDGIEALTITLEWDDEAAFDRLLAPLET
ncbi:MAG: tetraacyldisaccharide 4'-kinase [Rhodospirillales bacterium]